MSDENRLTADQRRDFNVRLDEMQAIVAAARPLIEAHSTLQNEFRAQDKRRLRNMIIGLVVFAAAAGFAVEGAGPIAYAMMAAVAYFGIGGMFQRGLLTTRHDAVLRALHELRYRWIRTGNSDTDFNRLIDWTAIAAEGKNYDASTWWAEVRSGVVDRVQKDGW